MRPAKDVGTVTFPEAEHRARRCAKAIEADREALIEEVRAILKLRCIFGARDVGGVPEGLDAALDAILEKP